MTTGDLFGASGAAEPAAGASLLTLDTGVFPAGLRVGTSSFSNDDWRGVFYPRDARPGDYLRWYSRQLKTVEIDATFYATPSSDMVRGWASKVGPDFQFSLKAPCEITHNRGLVDCGAAWNAFWHAIEPLGERRGPVVFQFPYVARSRDPEEHRRGDDFRKRLSDFLPLLSAEGRYVVEVRNGGWIAAPLLELLASRGVALALIDYYTMPPVAEIFARCERDRCEPVTADFGYVRFLGNHHQMDALVAAAKRDGSRPAEWGSLLVDRTREMRAWVPALRGLLARVPLVFAYYNNHYAGFAPGSIDLLRRLWREDGDPPPGADTAR